jgi:hypothetical protein
MRTIRSVVNSGKQVGRALYGLYEHGRSGNASPEAWRALLALHCETSGRSSDRFATLLRRMRPPRRPAPATGILGSLSIERQREIADRLAVEGYYVFEQLVPSDVCDRMEDFARRTPAIVEGRSSDPGARVQFDAAAPASKTYRMSIEDIVREPAMQRLMADASVLAVAEGYLSTHPILAGINMWWSPAFGDTPGEDAAQMFHFDFDGAPVWLKFFLYLTDVGPENGPHVFVRGSHRTATAKSAALLSRGYVRISDADIADAYGESNIIEIGGRRGTVLAVDTRGFHKGKMPVAGHRLIAQLLFCCPQFNYDGPRQPLPDTIDPLLSAAKKATPRVFERFA